MNLETLRYDAIPFPQTFPPVSESHQVINSPGKIKDCYRPLYSKKKYVALVANAADEIGLAATRLLAFKGYKVYAACSTPYLAYNLQRLAESSDKITIMCMNIKSSSSIEKTVNTILTAEEKIDFLINNVSIKNFGNPELYSEEEIKEIFDINVMGPMRLSQAVIPVMAKQLKGRIIYLGSLLGSMPSISCALYSASKAALESLAASEAGMLARWKIHVSIILCEDIAPSFHKIKDITNSKLEYPLLEDIQVIKKKSISEEPDSLARLILHIIETPKPWLWYPTNDKVMLSLSQTFKDITGHSRIPRTDHAKL